MHRTYPEEGDDFQIAHLQRNDRIDYFPQKSMDCSNEDDRRYFFVHFVFATCPFCYAMFKSRKERGFRRLHRLSKVTAIAFAILVSLAFATGFFSTNTLSFSAASQNVQLSSQSLRSALFPSLHPLHKASASSLLRSVKSQKLDASARSGDKTSCRSWSIGPFGAVESAEAFRIYYLPFVEPLEIDETLFDQIFGGWLGPLTPLILGVLIFWLQGQINAFRREQEGRVLGSAAKAVGEAATKTAESAAQSLSERLSKVPTAQWFKLLLCIALDLAGGLSCLAEKNSFK